MVVVVVVGGVVRSECTEPAREVVEVLMCTVEVGRDEGGGVYVARAPRREVIAL